MPKKTFFKVDYADRKFLRPLESYGPTSNIYTMIKASVYESENDKGVINKSGGDAQIRIADCQKIVDFHLSLWNDKEIIESENFIETMVSALEKLLLHIDELKEARINNNVIDNVIDSDED